MASPATKDSTIEANGDPLPQPPGLERVGDARVAMAGEMHRGCRPKAEHTGGGVVNLVRDESRKAACAFLSSGRRWIGRRIRQPTRMCLLQLDSRWFTNRLGWPGGLRS